MSLLYVRCLLSDKQCYGNEFPIGGIRFIRFKVRFKVYKYIYRKT